MGEHKQHTGATRGRFREAADGNDYILPLYRTYETDAHLVPNATNPRTGKPLPRVNHAKRAMTITLRSPLPNVAEGVVALKGI